MSMAKIIAAASMMIGAATAHAETINFDADRPGTPPAGWTCGSTGGGTPVWTVEAEVGCAKRRQCPETDRQGAVSLVRQTGHGGRERNRRGEVQAAVGPRRPSRRRGVALEGRRQLLCRARQCAGEQRLALLHRARPAADDQVRRRAGAGQCLAYAPRRVQRHADPRDAGRQDLHRSERQPYSGAGAVGVWTKADSVTAFDDFTFQARP